MDLLWLLTPESLATLDRLSLQEPDRARRLLRALGERAGPPHEAVPVLEALLAALPQAPDPELALIHLERWSSFLPTPRSTLALLRDNPRLLADLLAVFGASRYLAEILARDPWLYSMFLEPDGPRDRAAFAAAIRAALRPLQRPESRRDALRRVKRREFLRIGWRDLARRAPLEEIVREISDLADALIEAALQLAREEVDPRFPTASAVVRFAVIAMGKLGARELNYSSDVDLLFLMDSPSPQEESHRRYATRLGETLVAVLGGETAEGRCFRVDLRLRPEGRFGPIVRSFAAFRAYYDRWAETWERQALIKARPVAGDPALGRRFMELTRPVVYRRMQGDSLLQDVREMRAAVERKLDSAGELEVHVKEGRGTIRDVEFTVQLLQLLFGAERPELQAPDTLTALARLEEVGLLTPQERATFAEGYRFFREVEHRLQLLQDLPVRVLPSDPADLRRLARSMGFDSAEPFLAAYRARSAAVERLAQSIHARLGAAGGAPDPFREAILAADTPAGERFLRAELERDGFPEPERALEALVRLAVGEPAAPHPASTRRLFADLAPTLLASCAAAADATEALEGLAAFAERKLLHRALYQTLLEHPDSLGALCRFAGGAPAAMRVVLRYPELSDRVTDAELLARVRSREELAAELAERLGGPGALGDARRLALLRRFKLRELVRIAARHVLAPVPPEIETGEWTDLADVLLSAALEGAVAQLREQGRWPREDAGAFAVFALGRFGARDLHFPSDLDLLYVYRSGGGLRQQEYERLAAALGESLQAATEEGPLFSIDLRLRPEGRQGFAVASLEAARRYYGDGGRAEPWEFQMLTRLRFVAGSPEVAEAFRTIVEPRIYRRPMPEEWRMAIRGMKRRMETERVPAAERERHLKLGPGGLADIEFAVQFLQLRHGAEAPEVRTPELLPALAALNRIGALAAAEAATLADAWRFLTTLRQSLWLLEPEGSADLVPREATEPRRARALARALRCDAPAQLLRAYREKTAAARRVFERLLGEG